MLIKLDIDHYAGLVALVALSLLWLPASYLLSWKMAFWLDLLLMLALVWAFFWHKKSLQICLACLFFCNLCAYFHSQAMQALNISQQLAQLAPKLTTQWKVEQILQQQGYQQFIAQVDFAPPIGKQRLLLDWQGESSEPLQVGQIWQGEIKLKAISSRLNQGGFDRQQWAFAKGISAFAKVKSAVLFSEVFSSEKANWREQWLQQSLQQTQGLSQQGLLLALSFGERAWLPHEDWRLFQQTNTAHLIAISGLHIGLAMGMGFYLVRLLQFFFPLSWINPKPPLFGALLFACFYAYLAGMAIPTLRALVALILLLLWQSRGYYLSPWRLFLRCLALLLLTDPMMILAQSFWLSAWAVACLILWYQIFPLRLLCWRGRPLSQHRLRYLWGLLHLQTGLLLLFTPIQIAFFGGFSWAGFGANLLIVPYFSLCLVPLLLLVLCLQIVGYQLPVLNWQCLNQLAQWALDILRPWQDYWQFVSETELYVLVSVLAFSLAIWLCWQGRESTIVKKMPTPFWLAQKAFPLTLEKNPQGRLWQVFVAIGILMLSLCSLQSWQKPSWRLDMLDVGQGLAILIVKNGRGTLYDTGASWQTGSMAQLEILPLLRRQGIVLEQLILSHDDNDHAGGVPDILEAFPQVKFISSSKFPYQANKQNSSPKNFQKNQRTFCVAGLRWHWQGLLFEALAPNFVLAKAKNTDSCVLRISDQFHSVLLTGDADIASEKRFLPYLNLSQTDILQVGHHGSKTSTSTELLNQLQSKIALISAGRWNPWHFPHQQVLERLQAQRIISYNSAEYGQVSILFQQNKLEIHTMRHAFSPWYRGIIGEIQK